MPHNRLWAEKICRLNYWRWLMSIPLQPDQELEQRLASRLLDVLIRDGLILAMAMRCSCRTWRTTC
jgi:hypothetical protein